MNRGGAASGADRRGETRNNQSRACVKFQRRFAVRLRRAATRENAPRTRVRRAGVHINEKSVDKRRNRESTKQRSNSVREAKRLAVIDARV